MPRIGFPMLIYLDYGITRARFGPDFSHLAFDVLFAVVLGSATVHAFRTRGWFGPRIRLSTLLATMLAFTLYAWVDLDVAMFGLWGLYSFVIDLSLVALLMGLVASWCTAFELAAYALHVCHERIGCSRSRNGDDP